MNQNEIKKDFSLLPSYERVLSYIRTHPGARGREIAEATGADIYTTRKRLLRLQAERAVRAERYPKALLFYVEDQ
jgi:predicted transcriptional regulator